MRTCANENSRDSFECHRLDSRNSGTTNGKHLGFMQKHMSN